MEHSQTGFNIMVGVCLILALLLQVYPLGETMNAWRPHFVLLLSLYLAFQYNLISAIWFAFFAGLLTDLVSGSVLGKHALALTLSMLLMVIISPRIKHGKLWHETIVAALAMLVCEMVLQSVNLFYRETVKVEWTIFPALATLLVWPIVDGFLLKVLPVKKT